MRAFERQEARGGIFEILHDEVAWTIDNGRTHTSQAGFLAKGAAPVMGRLASTLVMTIRALWTDGDTMIIRFDGDVAAIDGAEYHNEYCRVWRPHGGRVARSHASMDIIAVQELIDHVEPG